MSGLPPPFMPLSLWSVAYCTQVGLGAGGCFPYGPSGIRNPSFCIAGILHATCRGGSGGQTAWEPLGQPNFLPRGGPCPCAVACCWVTTQTHSCGGPECSCCLPHQAFASLVVYHHQSPTGDVPTPVCGQHHQTHLLVPPSFVPTLP